METLTDAGSHEAARESRHRVQSIPLAATATGTLAYAVFLAVLAHSLDAGRVSDATALLALAIGSVVAGTLYLAGLFYARRWSVSIRPPFILAVGIAARLIVAGAPPMLESDYQRYLWDGAVVAAGMNPYRHAPGDIVAGIVAGGDVERLQALAAEAGPILSRINHPQLTTVYPPVAQVGFAAAHLIDPFGVTGWRVILLLADTATMVLLARLLRNLSLPATQIAWFAWNPILLREGYSALHMDILLLPLLVGAVLAGVRSRATLGATLCIVGSAVKVWPIVLTPLLLRPLLGRPRALVAAIASGALLMAVLWLPVLVVPHGHNSGLLAYGQNWQNNDGFFRAGIWLTERVLKLIHVEAWHSHAIMRVVSAALLVGAVSWQLRIGSCDPRGLPSRCLVVVGAIFLLSPTQFPWYWLWCLPLLTIRPGSPLLLYSALLPLYYLQDRTQAVYWLEHAPVWGLLMLAAIRALRSQFASGRLRAEVARA